MNIAHSTVCRAVGSISFEATAVSFVICVANFFLFEDVRIFEQRVDCCIIISSSGSPSRTTYVSAQWRRQQQAEYRKHMCLRICILPGCPRVLFAGVRAGATEVAVGITYQAARYLVLAVKLLWKPKNSHTTDVCVTLIQAASKGDTASTKQTSAYEQRREPITSVGHQERYR